MFTTQPHRHTINRSVGNRIEQEQEHTRPGAAYRFAVEVERVIRGFGLADTVAGARAQRRANRIADAIHAGHVVGAELSFEGERVTYTAPVAARPSHARGA